MMVEDENGLKKYLITYNSLCYPYTWGFSQSKSLLHRERGRRFVFSSHCSGVLVLAVFIWPGIHWICSIEFTSTHQSNMTKDTKNSIEFTKIVETYHIILVLHHQDVDISPIFGILFGWVFQTSPRLFSILGGRDKMVDVCVFFFFGRKPGIFRGCLYKCV